MHALIKSSEVARRLRGMGGAYYVVDAYTDHETIVFNARHFRPRGLNLDALCREGRVRVVMQTTPSYSRLSNAENRRLVSREIRRQARLTDGGASFINPAVYSMPPIPSEDADPFESEVTQDMVLATEKDETFIPFDG